MQHGLTIVWGAKMRGVVQSIVRTCAKRSGWSYTLVPYELAVPEVTNQFDTWPSQSHFSEFVSGLAAC